MGLTIHYNFEYHGKEAYAKINSLRDYASQLPFKELGEIVHLEGKECDFHKIEDKDFELRWLLIQAQAIVDKEQYYFSISPKEVYAFTAWAGDGCESSNFGLCRYPVKFWTDHYGFLPTNKGTGWHWGSFCKTQYANEYGIANFINCHTMVIGVLDAARHLGILKEVSDEGKYWENRNFESLAKTIGEWDAFIAQFAGKLVDNLGRNNISAPILERPDFEHLEMGKTEPC